jgi:hypothetical protein
MKKLSKTKDMCPPGVYPVKGIFEDPPCMGLIPSKIRKKERKK